LDVARDYPKRLLPNYSLLLLRGLLYCLAGMATCAKCDQASKILRLHKCAVCFKLVCDKCAVQRYAQMFCSHHCVKIFFFSDEE